jgi:prepilin-type N-terminal cleavage/methylation domain-containing protein/prepilin-type processing-associated H-X9-DG protein
VRNALTLIELLIVIAVIAILVSLGLPAVQATRESSRSISCQNNIRQLALASQNHQLAIGFFPSGGWGYAWLGVDGQGLGKQQPGSWLFSLLAFIEQEHVVSLAPSQAHPLSSNETSMFVNQIVPTFLCPSKALPRILPANQTINYRKVAQFSEFARCDYAINSGSSVFLNVEGPLSLDLGGYVWPNRMQARGMTYERSELRPNDVTDGLSNVLICGEKWAPTVPEGRGFDQPWSASESLDVKRFAEKAPTQDGLQSGNEFQFGSAHHSCNFAFVDGSVRALAYSIHPFVFRNLSDRNDGQPVWIE